MSEEEGGFFPVNKQLYTLSVQSGTALSVNSYLRLSQKVDVRCVGHKAQISGIERERGGGWGVTEFSIS